MEHVKMRLDIKDEYEPHSVFASPSYSDPLMARRSENRNTKLRA